jgi:hypothetical protein
VAERDPLPQSSELAKEKRSRPRRRFPAHPLKEVLAIAQSISDNNAGKPYSRLSLAETLGRSPDSSQFRALISASSAYGLTEGSYQAPTISLTDLGLSIVSPRSDAEKKRGLVDAAMRIELFRKLFEHYDQHNIPAHANLKNTLIRDYELDPEQAEECISYFRGNGLFVGLIRTVSGSEWVDISRAINSIPASNWTPSDEEDSGDERITDLRLLDPSSKPGSEPISVPNVQRVFITHGKNHEIVDQLKDLLTFGKFVPVVAEEQETPSKPVPDKVLDAMRSCFAGIIHVSSEAELLDREGQVHHKINENVLIEIGAAMALYGSNFILFVQKGIHLPSNLQGLYRCEYEGAKLDYDATMKLLKAFNEFK